VPASNQASKPRRTTQVVLVLLIPFNNFHAHSPLSAPRLVILPQSLLDLGELALGLLDDFLEVVEALVVIGHVFAAVGALVRAEVLDLFAAVFDLGHAEGGT
jgi:hypothetical protein